MPRKERSNVAKKPVLPASAISSSCSSAGVTAAVTCVPWGGVGMTVARLSPCSDVVVLPANIEGFWLGPMPLSHAPVPVVVVVDFSVFVRGFPRKSAFCVLMGDTVFSCFTGDGVAVSSVLLSGDARKEAIIPSQNPTLGVVATTPLSCSVVATTFPSRSVEATVAASMVGTCGCVWGAVGFCLSVVTPCAVLAGHVILCAGRFSKGASACAC